MKIRLFSGLKGRMLLLIGSVVCVGLALIVGIVAREVMRAARIDAIALAQRQSELVAVETKATIHDALNAARSLANVLEWMKQGAAAPDRAHATAMVQRVLEAHPELLGAWTVWEAEAFDGRDAEFANQPGHDASGRFIPYWNRSSGQIALEATRDYAVEGAGDFYLVTRKLDREHLTEPYAYAVAGREVMMTTLAVPIHDSAGTVVGVAGVDISLQSLADRIARTKVGERGYAALVSGAGIYVAHPTADRIGQPIEASDPWVKPFLPRIREGSAFLTESFSRTLDSQTFRVASPLIIGATQTAWSAILTVPEVEVLASAKRMARVVAVVGIVVLLGVLAVVLVVAHRIARPVQEIASALQGGAEQTAAASAQVSAASRSLAQGASEQAASLEETGASCEEMASMTKRNAEHATQAKALAAESRAAADGGATDLRELTAAMTELQEASASVAKIVKTIDEIAFQTNILALNAAVEAARAGEAGMGFAVVAEEVRSLAQRSAQAAKETAATIETTIQRSDRGFDLSRKVVAMLEALVGKVRQVDELVGQIASASNEQSQGIGQINTAVRQMDAITQRTAAEAEETASASEELNSQSEMLKETAERLMALVTGARGTAGAPAGVAQPSAPAHPARGANGETHRKGAVHPPARSRSNRVDAGDVDRFFADTPANGSNGRSSRAG